jgi:hypothetical protein
MEGGERKKRTLGRLSCDTIVYAQIGLAAVQQIQLTRGILSRWVPSRAAIVCSPGCKSSNRQVAARSVRGQAGKSHPNCCWPGPIGAVLPPFLLVPGSQLRPCWVNSTKHNSILFFSIELYTLTSRLRTCESVASSTFAVLSNEICNSQSLDSISVIGISSLAFNQTKSAHCNTAFQLPTSNFQVSPNNHARVLYQTGQKLVEWSEHHGNCSSSHAVSALVESTDSNGVRVDPQAKPPLHPNRPYGSIHSQDRERDLENHIKTPTL